MKQDKMFSFINPSLNWDKTKPRKRQAGHHSLVEMICEDFQSVSIVEDEGFKPFVKSLQPAYKLSTRQHFRNILIPGLYKSVSTDIRWQLSDIHSISLTMDYWISQAHDSYIWVTAHFLMPSFDVKDFCLNVSHSPHSHTAENISKEICSTVRKQFTDGDGNKINIYVVSDNAANMVAVSNLLPSNYQPLRFFAHKLQFFIKEPQRMISTKNDIKMKKNCQPFSTN